MRAYNKSFVLLSLLIHYAKKYLYKKIQRRSLGAYYSKKNYSYTKKLVLASYKSKFLKNRS